MNSRLVVYAIVVALVMSPYTQAQAPNSWGKVEAKATGTELIVSLKTGTLVEGFLKSVGADDLTIVLPTGSDFRVVKTDVREVRTRYRDSALLGYVIDNVHKETQVIYRVQ